MGWTTADRRNDNVSVLFSEPKIPQNQAEAAESAADRRFSALQRAENSSKVEIVITHPPHKLVSVLFSEPKIPQTACDIYPAIHAPVSVLFSEPKIPQRAYLPLGGSGHHAVSVLFSEPKIPQTAAEEWEADRP